MKSKQLRQLKWIPAIVATAQLVALPAAAAEHQAVDNVCATSELLASPHFWRDSSSVVVSLRYLVRTPSMMTRLTWAYCNTSASPTKIDGWTNLGGSDQGAHLVKLFDRVSGKTYSPVLLEGYGFGSLIPDQLTLLPGVPFTIWMNFPELPTTIDDVNVWIEGVTPFSGVPID